MKRPMVFMAILSLILVASLVWAEDYRVIQRISVPGVYLFDVALTLSPDGSKTAFWANRDGKWSVWINDRKVPPEFGYAGFSPDGSKIVYMAKSGGKRSIWINDRKVSPERVFDETAFAQEHFNKTGELIFAGFDRVNGEIVHAALLETTPQGKVEETFGRV